MRRIACGLMLVLAITTACTQQPISTETPPMPTLAETSATQVPADAPVQGETVVPSRPTLPPTWTPAVIGTPTIPAFVTVTPDGTLEALRALPTFPACGTFVVDISRTAQTYLHQQPVTVAWGPAVGADVYRITLFDTSGMSIYGDTTRDTAYTFPGNLFVLGNFYGWEVRPADVTGIQFCMPIGDDITSE